MISLGRIAWIAAFAALLAGGCVLSDSSQGNLAVGPDAGAGDDFDRDDCKIEGGDIGVEGVSIDVGDVSVTFSDWVDKDGESGEYVGFTIDAADGEIPYTVKTGGGLYSDDASTWLHPDGTSGPEASAISYVDICEDGDPPGGGDDGGSDDGDDGTGDDDGSDDGGDGGTGDDDGSDDDGGGDDGGDDDIIIE